MRGYTYKDEQVAQWLKHIGHEHDLETVRKQAVEDPLACLTRIQILQMARVPFESISLHYSRFRNISLHPEELYGKIVGRGMGGYCMEVNTFFAAMLRGLGFQLFSVGARVNVPGRGYQGW
jgi:arylamine N-acetyltransferase